MQFSSLPINSSLQNNPRYQVSLTLENIEFFSNFVSGHFENKNDPECNFHLYQSIPHFKITIEINFHWNQRTLKFCQFFRRPLARDFFFVIIFYQPYLIYMASLVEIRLAVSDISEVNDFDICSRFPWQRRPFWKF